MHEIMLPLFLKGGYSYHFLMNLFDLAMPKSKNFYKVNEDKTLKFYKFYE